MTTDEHGVTTTDPFFTFPEDTDVVQADCQHRLHYEVVMRGCDCSGCWGEVSTCTHEDTDD